MGKSGVGWDETTGEYNFTRLGYTYYETIRRNYVAQVPVIITGKRKDGSFYTVKSSMPVSKLGINPTTLPTNNNDVTRRDKVRRLVEKELPDILYEQSDEVWRLDKDPAASWQIHEETVALNQEGIPRPTL